MLKRKEFILGAAVGLTFAAAATAGGVITWPGATAAPAAQVGQLVPSAGAAGLAFAPPQGAPLSFADIFQQVAPAVVQIDVKTRVQRPRNLIQIPGFGAVPIPGAPGGSGEEADTQLAAGAGSGFFISADGFIVTNNHVVENAEEITVRLNDERELKARLIGRDPLTDLAVIKVEGAAFPFVSFEDKAEPRVGDWVIAVGNPFGLGGTATAGIVSAKARAIGGNENPYTDFIQIDAAINRGNSGGPTFDIYGRVIGVNTAIVSPTGGSVGIGFAIPAGIAKETVDRLMRGEKIERGYLGVEIGNLTAEYRESLGLPEGTKGAYVTNVTAGAPGDRAGLQPGDVVVSLNGRPIEGSNELTRAVGAAKPGDTLRLELLREGRRQTVTVRAGTRPSNLGATQGEEGEDSTAPGAPEAVAGEKVEGLTVAPISAALRSRYDLSAETRGVVITAVEAQSRAGRLGFRPGFVVVQANGRPVSSVKDFRDAVEATRAAGRPGVLLLVKTPNGNVPIVVPFAKSE
ncbi:Do family serine endopeptidase [Brevundimonas naejangsanensis]|uniref:Do family serine endopeptidase n=1 Tax=Brevundimonas naejangsanensis TaxID=588932 RepID=A0A494RDG8_9CAUL|nr:Do family serine endopeptidase [Brevundimonas naejangsanensis]AYG94181.1 Do family serine endopeptidase [Brevundimonas naejangsanensis]